MLWARDGKEAVRNKGWHHLLDNARGTSWAISSACSGVLTAEVGIKSAAANLGFTVRSLWCVDKARTCQEEALCNESLCPESYFADMWDFLTPAVQKAISAIPEDKVDERRANIMGNPTMKQAWCIRKGRSVTIARADLHVAGTPCVHDSPFGKGGGLAGKHVWVLMVFCR